MQGWGPDFVPKLTGDAVDMNLIHQLLTIAAPEAMKCSKDLAQKEGIFVGITAGGTFAAALKVAQQASKGRPSSPCCRTPASATCRRRSSPTSRPT